MKTPTENIATAQGMNDFSKLYKYKAIDKNLCELIAKNELFFSGRRLLNDPNEAILRFTNQQVLVKGGLCPNRTEVLKAPQYHGIDDYYFFCMSRELADIPMWGYYGDNHRGVCLQFDFGTAIRQWRDQPEKPWKIETDHGIPFIRDVHYQEDLDEFTLAPDGTPNLTPEQADEFGFNKLSCWSREQEVRMRLDQSSIAKDETMPEGLHWRFEKKSLASIYFGVRTDKKNKAKLLDLTRSLGYDCAFFEGYDIKRVGSQQLIAFRPYVE